jgi:hypothetical protein
MPHAKPKTRGKINQETVAYTKVESLGGENIQHLTFNTEGRSDRRAPSLDIER